MPTVELQTEVIPYNDDIMTYNKTFHQYELNKDAVKNLLNIELEDDVDDLNEVGAVLREISLDIYNFIYSFKETEQIPKMEYLLATRDYFREGVFRMMLAEVRYYFYSKGTMLKTFHGMNVEKATTISVETLRGELTISQMAYNEAHKYGFMYKTFFDNHARFNTLLQRGVDY